MTVALAALAVLAVAGRADAAVYSNSFGEIDRANNDGSLLAERFIEPNRSASPSRSDTSEGVSGCEGIAVDGSHIYWADPSHGAIDRADLDGGNVDYGFVTGLVNPCGVAVDAGSVYWTDFQAGTIGRVGLEGGEPDRELIRGLRQPCGVAVGGQYLYWTGRNVETRPPDYLARRPLAGGLPEVLAEGESFCGVAVDATHVYWGGFGTTIGRVGLDGSDPEPSFIAGIDRPCGVALYGSQIYWSRNDQLDPGIQTAPLSEPASIGTVFGDSLGVPCGVAVDSVQIQPPPPPPAPAPPPPSHLVSFAHQRHGKGPVTFITVKFPQPGTFTVSGGPALRVQVRPRGPSPRTILGPEARVLRVSPKKAGRAAKALRAKLAKRGVVQVAIRVHFAAADGSGSTQREPLSLNGHRHARSGK
jgi:hypothetical protein